MYNTIYEIAVVDCFGEKGEKVIKSHKLTDFNKALTEFYKIIGEYQEHSSVLYNRGADCCGMYCFVGTTFDRVVFLNEVGWIDDNGEHYFNNNN